MIRPYMVLRAMSGVLIMSGAIVGFYNVLMTAWRGRPVESALPQEVQVA